MLMPTPTVLLAKVVERPGRIAVGDALRLHVPPTVRWRAPWTDTDARDA